MPFPTIPLFNYSLLISFIGVLLIGCKSDSSEVWMPSGESTYVGSNTCISCHTQAYEDWKQSDHFYAMLPANDSTVLGDFNNTTFIADGVTNKFFKKENKYFINTQGEDGLNHDFEIAYTFGVYPLQQYLISFPGGRLQTTRASWDSRDHKWFHQYPEQVIDPNDWFHWTGASQNWNTMCASCHSTNLQKNYDAESDSFTTTWDEINVSCESCHGPGSTHIAYVNSNAYGEGVGLVNSGFLYARDTTPQMQLNACAACHARKSDISADLIRSNEILDDLIPQVLSNEFYFADGQIKEEDYVYGSFTQSKMFHSNVSCTDCHNPHSGKLKIEGNDLCLSCHTPNYNTAEHHFHQRESEGSKCINCHMVSRTYMGNDHRRDHSFRVPRPDQSVRYGTPNACTHCHQTESDQWASQSIIDWYGKDRAYHFSDDLIPGSLLNEKSESHLTKLLADTTQPAIARATAAFYLGDVQTIESVSSLVNASSDHMAIVRYNALRALENFPPESWSTKVSEALNDKVRAVRIAAADLYHRLPDGQIPAAAKERFSAANKENASFLQYQADFSVGNVMIADYELQEGDYQDAIKYYRRGLEKDRLMNYARLNLATVYSIIGENENALKTLKEAGQIDPLNDRVHYNLGLLQYEMNDMDAAGKSFQKAVNLKSLNPSVYYNYGLLLQQQTAFKKAEEVYQMGYQLDPQAININYALTLLYIQLKKSAPAKKHGEILKNLAPAHPDFQQLFQTLGI